MQYGGIKTTICRWVDHPQMVRPICRSNIGDFVISHILLKIVMKRSYYIPCVGISATHLLMGKYRAHLQIGNIGIQQNIQIKKSFLLRLKRISITASADPIFECCLFWTFGWNNRPSTEIVRHPYALSELNVWRRHYHERTCAGRSWQADEVEDCQTDEPADLHHCICIKTNTMTLIYITQQTCTSQVHCTPMISRISCKTQVRKLSPLDYWLIFAELGVNWV